MPAPSQNAYTGIRINAPPFGSPEGYPLLRAAELVGVHNLVSQPSLFSVYRCRFNISKHVNIERKGSELKETDSNRIPIDVWMGCQQTSHGICHRAHLR